MEQRIVMNSNEKIARMVSGLESDAKHFVVNGEAADKVLQREAINKYNTQVSEYEEKLNKYEAMVEDCKKEVTKDLKDLQIKPLSNYVIVKPYNENPFQQIKRSDSGIITDLGGMTPTYKSNETGEWEEEDLMIKTGVIMEVGPDCKYAKVGDSTFWTIASEVMLPFFRQGFFVVNETRLLALINSDLDTRF
jgi:hypothetical protein